MEILVTQNFVGEPVEDVEDEEGEGKESARDGVDSFGAVNEPAADLEHRVTWRKSGEHGRRLREGTVPGQVDVQAEVGHEVILVVLR